MKIDTGLCVSDDQKDGRGLGKKQGEELRVAHLHGITADREVLTEPSNLEAKLYLN